MLCCTLKDYVHKRVFLAVRLLLEDAVAQGAISHDFRNQTYKYTVNAM